MHHDLERRQLGDGEAPVLCIQREALRDAKRLLVAPGFELRKLHPARKKVPVRRVQIAQGHLQGLRIDFPQPGVFRLSFQGCQPEGGVLVIQALLLFPLVGGVEIHALAQKEIVHEAGTPELAGQRLALIGVRVEPEFEGLMDLHRSYCSTNVLEYKRLPPSAERLSPAPTAGAVYPHA